MKKYILVVFCFCCLFMQTEFAVARQMVLLAPGKTDQTNKSNVKSKNLKVNEIETEMDILTALVKTDGNLAFDMDMPQSLASVCFEQNASGDITSERKDLLGDLEEIRYKDKRAWSTNVGLNSPALCQFILDSKPRWDEEKQIYHIDSAKVIVPAPDSNNGWTQPAGQTLEIVPLSLPFGLTAPCMFGGQVLFDGKPASNIEVYLTRLNDSAKTRLQDKNNFETRSDVNGQFAFVINQPGWWSCQAVRQDAPLKGPDGEMKPSKRATAFWFYVEPEEKK